MEPIKVGMAEYKVSQSPALLTSIGLGSCIGLVFYDAINKIGALAHIMLPKRSAVKNRSNPVKFADSCIHLMLAEMAAHGSCKRHIKAKMFGGADMFPNLRGKQLMNVGARNAAAVKEELANLKIAVVGEDIGGHHGRTIVLNTSDGRVRVSTALGETAVY